jgi:hypothetical protein
VGRFIDFRLRPEAIATIANGNKLFKVNRNMVNASERLLAQHAIFLNACDFHEVSNHYSLSRRFFEIGRGRGHWLIRAGSHWQLPSAGVLGTAQN